MENFFLALLLAHLLGDYVFQTNWIYQKKIKSFWGGLYHATEIFLSLFLIFFPYFSQLWFWFLGYTVVHFFQDSVKVLYNQKEESKVFLAYFLDQLGHLITIFFMGFLAVYVGGFSLGEFWIPFDLLLLITVIVLVTRFWDVTEHVHSGVLKAYVPHYKKMCFRVLVVIFLFLGVLGVSLLLDMV